MVARSLVLVILLALGATPAFADARKLDKARDAVAAVRYDDAQVLLVEALQSGTNSPEELAEIYRLSASTAIVLGQADAAEQYYRRWLALVPTASLPESVAPKLRQPFVAAQAYMAAHGRLSVKAQRRTSVVDVIVESDPLGMVASIALDDGEARPLGADRAAHFEHAASQPSASVRVLDEFGNRLIVLSGDDIPRVAAPPREDDRAVSTGAPRVPLYRHPLAWTIAGSAFAIGGVAFGLAARSAHDDVVAISANPGEHFPEELEAARSRRDRNALVANIGFVAAGACAVTAAILWATRPSSTVAVVPTTAGAAVVMSRAF